MSINNITSLNTSATFFLGDHVNNDNFQPTSPGQEKDSNQFDYHLAKAFEKTVSLQETGTFNRCKGLALLQALPSKEWKAVNVSLTKSNHNICKAAEEKVFKKREYTNELEEKCCSNSMKNSEETEDYYKWKKEVEKSIQSLKSLSDEKLFQAALNLFREKPYMREKYRAIRKRMGVNLGKNK